MAYITAAEVKVIRDNLKKAFPIKDGWKWSVRKTSGNLAVTVSLMQYPAGYIFPEYKQVNHYYLETAFPGKQEIEVFEKVKNVVSAKHWDDSDVMTDYFNCAFYYDLHVGKWNKPAVVKK